MYVGRYRSPDIKRYSSRNQEKLGDSSKIIQIIQIQEQYVWFQGEDIRRGAWRRFEAPWERPGSWCGGAGTARA